MVTDAQVKLYRKKRMEGKNQEQASAATGICLGTAQRWEKGELPSQRKKQRAWRTRADPFAKVWEDNVVPLLEADTFCVRRWQRNAWSSVRMESSSCT